MKRIISLCLVSVFIGGYITPLLAQAPREVRVLKTKAGEAANRFGSVRAYSDGSGVLVEWQMAAEKENAGFNVERLDGESSAVVNDSMILGSAASYGARAAKGEKYSFFDPNGTAGSVYVVKSFAFNGSSEVSQSAAVESVTDLSAVGGSNSAELFRQVAESKSKGNVIAERLELPKTLAKEVSENRTSADAATHAWVVSQPGVKIGLQREGFYRVTKAELLAAGFNVAGNAALWQLYREGVEQAINIGPNADYIEFYGKGIDTQETDTAVYYLVSGPADGKRISSRPARPVAGTVTSPNYSQTFFQKQRLNYLNQVLNGEAENYWGAVINGSANMTYNFTLTGVDFNVAQSSMEVKFQGYSLTAHSILVTLNGQPLAGAAGSIHTPYSKQYVIPTSYLREGANSIVFRSNTTVDFNLFNSISIGFRRKQVAAQDKLRFYTENYRLSKLTGFTTPNVRVFDMTNEASPVEWTNLNVIPENSAYSVRMPSDRGRSMYALADTAILSAASVTLNDPTVLKSPTQAANLVIITHKNWMAEAEAWANYRRAQGFLVKVIETSEIYDEFNYGDFNSIAIRSFLQYAKNNWQTPPTYALLLGDASYDSRNYENLGFNNYVPTHLVNTVFGETGSDDYLADFNGDGLSDMAIGRIPARTAQAVTNALAKVTAFEAAAPTPQSRGVLFAYDWYDGLNNYDFQAISARLKNQLPVNVPSTMIGRGDSPPPPDTPQSQLISSMNTGKYLVNYSGHGTTGAWAGQDFFSNLNVPALTNAGANQSVFTMLTCLNGYFLHVTNKSLAEVLLESTSGGAVAAWASTGETTPDVQEAMASRFYLKIGQGQIPRLGDLVNDAKSVIPGGTDVRLSWALLGDPMLKVR